MENKTNLSRNLPLIAWQSVSFGLTEMIPLPANLMRTTSRSATIPRENAMTLDTTVAFLSDIPGLHGLTKSSSMMRAPEFNRELIVLQHQNIKL